MRSCTPPGIPRFTKHLAFGDRLPSPHELLREMSVPRLATILMIDDHGITVTVLNTRERDHPIGSGLHVAPICHRKVDALMKRRFTRQRILTPSEPAAHAGGRCDVTDLQRL